MTDLYRPLYHFTPPAHKMNDPNGLVYFEGEWHLFYQWNPDGRLHWGHAVSVDLVHWTHLPVALFPDSDGDVWSGSAVVDARDATGFFDGGSGLVAFWTHHNPLTPPRGPQAQCLSYSRDRGRTWTNYDGNPVVPNPGIPDFRDPKVIWHEPTGQWVMALAVVDCIHFYTSPDLKTWTFASAFGAGFGSHEGIWECPDLFALSVEGADGQSRWVLIVSISGGGVCRTQYFVGEFDGRTFTSENTAETVLWADGGADNYAAVSWSDVPPGDGRRIWIGWMNHWQYAWDAPTEPWRGAMTLPRELGLRVTPDGIRLTQTPVRELETLRGPGRRWADVTVSPGTNLLTGMSGDAWEIAAEIECGSASAFGFRVCVGESEETVVGYDVAQSALFVDRTHSGRVDFHPAFAGRHSTFLPAPEGRVTLHLFVDRCSVEVFGNSGEAVVTDLIFPDLASLGLTLFADGGDIFVRSLSVYPLQP